MSGSRKILEIADSNNIYSRLLIVDGNGDLLNASEQNIANAPTLVEGKFYQVDLALDLKNDKYDVYIDSKLRGKDFLMNAKLTGPLQDISYIRLQVGNVAKGCTTKVYLDDFKAYEGEMPLTESDIENTAWNVEVGSDSELNDEMIAKMLTGTVCFYSGAKKALADGREQKIAENNADTPFMSEENLMVPLRFTLEKFGAKISYNAETNSAEIKLGNNTAIIPTGEINYTLNGEQVLQTAAAENKNGKLFASVKTLAEIAGKSYYEEKGFAVIGEVSGGLSWRGNPGVMAAVAGLMVYERPHGKEIINDLMLLNKHLNF